MCGSATEGLRLNLTIFKFDIINMHFLIIDMRNYLILDRSPSRATEIQEVLEGLEDFRCVSIINTPEDILPNLIQLTPELVLMHLDNKETTFVQLVEKLNHTLGVIPKYIGFAESKERGFEAYKAGFVDVILLPFTTEKLAQALNRYRYSYQPNTLYCIDWYHDYQYINLNDVLLLKADNYTSEFLMKDGTSLPNFKNLKNTHKDLPKNFQRIHRSWIVNSYYVYRINMHRNLLYLRHFNNPLSFTAYYKNNIIEIKKSLVNTSFSCF